MKEKILLVFWIFINIVIYWSSISLAYLDPSAMTYMIQVIAAIVITLSTSIGILFYKLKRKFFKKKKQNEVNETIDNTNVTNETENSNDNL